MRGRNKRGSRLAASLDAGGNIQPFLVNRHGHEMAAIQREDISSQAVTWFLYPHTTPGVEENASRNLERLLRTTDDHDLLRFAVQRSRGSQIARDRFPKSLGAHLIPIVR
jgi:hypothetical protein